MARYIGYCQGNRGETSRCGSRISGIRTKSQGSNIGIKTTIFAAKKDEDVLVIELTQGRSSAYNLPKLIISEKHLTQENINFIEEQFKYIHDNLTQNKSF